MRGSQKWMILLAVIALLLSGCGSATPTETNGKTSEEPSSAGPMLLRVGLATDMLTWDPHNYQAGQDATMQNFVFETLVSYDRDMNIVPKLATEWKQLSPTEWEFKLREGIKFTDGTPLDAEAVKLSLERCSQAPRGSGFAGFIDTVTVVDPHTVVLNLKYPFGPILNNLCNPVISIVSPAALEKYGDEISQHPVGTGPYKLVEWVPNEKLIVEHNPDYWGDLPPIQRMEFRPIPEESTRLMALKRGEVDLIENPPPHEVEALKNEADLDVVLTPRARNVWLGMNVTAQALSDVRVRKAIAHAVDNKAIVDYVLEGLGRPADSGFIPPEVCPMDPPVNVPFDPQRAKDLLAEAGYSSGLNLQLWTPEARYLRDKQVAEVIQQQLKQVGVNVEITVMEWGAYLAALGRHEGELFIIGWGFMTGEPAQALKQTMSSGSAFNYSAYSNPSFDQLLAQAEQEPDPKKRRALYQEMTEMIVEEDSVVRMLYHMYNCYGVSKRVEGINITPEELLDVSEAIVR